MIHPHTELKFIDENKGFGVVATKFIPKGTITWIFDKMDRVISPEEFENAGELYKNTLEKYCYRNPDGNYVFCWDIAKYVNHSFCSNCISTPYNFELAVRDIYPGEELTDDYGYLNATEPYKFPKEACSERTHVMPDDLVNFHPIWDKQIEEAFKNYNNVDQPLAELLEKTYIQKVTLIAEGKEKPDSILNCYCAPVI